MENRLQSSDPLSDAELHEENVAHDANTIQAIDKGSVHRICSGQVVLSLATAVKELMENSLDAKATCIEVRLKEYGSECIEVIDNGTGVQPHNFAGLTLKHHTSKLRDFSDLTNVDTFGFRGEALSSLCALSKLQISTRHASESVAAKLELDHNGKLISNTPCARQQGTTVTIQNLFFTLPVRHKEFQRNLKKEFAKMAQVVSAYGIISKGVRINCTNQIGKGKKTTVVSTNGNETIKENITNIFGAKQVGSLLEFVQAPPSEETCNEYGIRSENQQSSVFNLKGFVSTCVHGQGRSSTDRQFLFVNKRPCDLPKVTRVINEVYHMYNRHQYPFVMLDISLNKESVDVNVTPDKRQIFIENEKLLLATLKTSLIGLLEPYASVYSMNKPEIRSHTINQMFSTPQHVSTKPVLSSQNSCPESRTSKTKSITSTLANLKRSFSSAFAKSTDNDQNNKQEESTSKQRRLDTFVTKRTDAQCSDEPMSQPSVDSCSDLVSSQDDVITQSSDVTSQESDITVRTHDLSAMNSCDTFSSQNSGVSNQYKETEKTPDSGCDFKDFSSPSNDNNYDDNTKGSPLRQTFVDSSYLGYEIIHETGSQFNCVVNNDCDKQNKSKHLGYKLTMHASISPASESEAYNKFRHVAIKADLQETVVGDAEICSERIGVSLKKNENSSTQSGSQNTSQEFKITFAEVDSKAEVQRRQKTIAFSLDKLKSCLNSHQNDEQRGNNNGGWCRSFRAKIAPSENQAAEEELKKTINKDNFLQMQILGQFNLGFIIARLGQDLFIIDQHATDEKYNFEMLQRHTVIDGQKLIQPQRLELTAANEAILIDNVEVFHKNGFDLHIDETAPPTQRVKLVSMPVSKNWTFGKDDIDELLFMLSDTPGVMCRPSRVRAMFASRACRKSIMIGTALNTRQMTKLVRHMAEIDQPWNCPHGRPTMRHLINLDMLPDEKSQQSNSINQEKMT